MNRITYFKLESPYDGDKTKNAALSATEVDTNFFTLAGRDIKKIDVSDTDIIVTLLNGETVSTSRKLDGYAKDLKFDFNPETGVLTVSYNDDIVELSGFVTGDNVGPATNVKHNDTLYGRGSGTEPLSVARNEMTGQYKPVLEFIDMVDDNKCTMSKKSVLPCNPKSGDRYITKEIYNDYGFLYPYNGIDKLLCDLKEAGYEWDIPTKTDWDDMLNAIEPLKEWRNHNSLTCKTHLGARAGKYLKSVSGWRYEDTTCGIEDPCAKNCCNKGCYSETNPCFNTTTSEMGMCESPVDKYPNLGIDKYGFKALPAGYADEGDGCGNHNFQYFGERAYFWTKTTNEARTSAIVKRLDYNSSKVFQDVLTINSYASLRLVKKWTGNEFVGSEEIFGETYPTVLVPSSNGGCMVWTAINIQLSNKRYQNLIIPADDITCTTRYYLNEWDGDRWLKRHMQEGDSVVIVNAPNKKNNVEYRIINGVLTDTTSEIFNKVKDAVDGELTKIEVKINNINTKLVEHDNKINELSNDLELETQERKNEDVKLLKFIHDESEAREAEDQRIEENLNAEIADRKSEIERVEGLIETEASERKSESQRIETKLDGEIEERVAEVSRVESLIQEETERATGREEELNERIAVEEKVREDEDTRIEAKLDAEIKRSTENDDKLTEDIAKVQTNLDTETERAKKRENEIEAQIPNKAIYDEKTGTLSMSRGDEEKFNVNLSFNFGEF